MKKLISILTVLTVIFTLGACSKVGNNNEETTASGGEASASETATSAEDQKFDFSGIKVSSEDGTDTITFNSDGSYIGEYKGSQQSGKWEVNQEYAYITLSGSDGYERQFTITYDDAGNITGILQEGIRDLKVVTE